MGALSVSLGDESRESALDDREPDARGILPPAAFSGGCLGHLGRDGFMTLVLLPLRGEGKRRDHLHLGR